MALAAQPDTRQGRLMTASGWVVLSLLETSAEALLFSFLLAALAWKDLADDKTPAYVVVSTAF
jgi:hypothetical protein